MPHSKEYYKSRYMLRMADAGLMYAIECFGDELGEKNAYDCDGLDAVHVYLIAKHNWTVQYVRSMNIDDLRLALDAEMKGWILPLDARDTKKWASDEAK